MKHLLSHPFYQKKKKIELVDRKRTLWTSNRGDQSPWPDTVVILIKVQYRSSTEKRVLGPDSSPKGHQSPGEAKRVVSTPSTAQHLSGFPGVSDTWAGVCVRTRRRQAWVLGVYVVCECEWERERKEERERAGAAGGRRQVVAVAIREEHKWAASLSLQQVRLMWGVNEAGPPLACPYDPRYCGAAPRSSH